MSETKQQYSAAQLAIILEMSRQRFSELYKAGRISEEGKKIGKALIFDKIPYVLPGKTKTGRPKKQGAMDLL